MMESHRIASRGVDLDVVVTGYPRGRPVLFLHGVSQSSLCWSRQMTSDLAADFRLVAVDLRGHGLSGRTTHGAADARCWADDLHAVIGALHLEHPVLSGWSYGPLVMLDYLRHYGAQDLGGLQFVGGVTRLGSEKAAAVLAPEFLRLLPGLFATDVNESVRALESLLVLCFAQPLTAEEMFLMLGYNMVVQPGVRHAMLSRVVDNDDLVRTIKLPVLITHGAEDRVVSLAVTDDHRALIPHAQIQIIPGAGHAAFWDQAGAFNRQLREFADAV